MNGGDLHPVRAFWDYLQKMERRGCASTSPAQNPAFPATGRTLHRASHGFLMQIDRDEHTGCQPRTDCARLSRGDSIYRPGKSREITVSRHETRISRRVLRCKRRVLRCKCRLLRCKRGVSRCKRHVLRCKWRVLINKRREIRISSRKFHAFLGKTGKIPIPVCQMCANRRNSGLGICACHCKSQIDTYGRVVHAKVPVVPKTDRCLIFRELFLFTQLPPEMGGFAAPTP